MDKRYLKQQLATRLEAIARSARRAGEAAAQEAREGATPAERREDSRVALENSNLARAQTQRADRARTELAAVENMPLPKFGPKDAIGIGAIVEIEDEEEGGRTFFLAPVGAGEELTGPDGDGILSVVTPASPVGKAVLGRRVGDVVEITVRGELRELTITYVE